MEAMLQQVQTQYDQSINLLTSLNTTMTVDVGQELKKQTSLLMSIEAKIGTNGGSAGEDKMLGKNLEILSKGLSKLVKAAEKIKPKTGEQVKEFLGNIADGLASLTDKIDEKKAEIIANTVITLAKGVLLFGLAMTLYVILGPTAMLGSMLFGLTIRLLLKSAGEVDENSLKGIVAVAALGLGVIYFGLAMALYAVIGIPAMLGAVLFGLTVRLLAKTAGLNDPKVAAGIVGIAALGLGAIYFGLAMLGYAIIGIPAMLGAVLFGLTVRLLVKTAGLNDPKVAAGMQALIGLGKAILIFGLVMLAYAIIGIPGLIGALVLALTLKLLSKSIKSMGSNMVRKGIINMALGAIAIILLGLTIILFAKEVPIMSSLYVILTIGAFALAFYIVGKFFNDILKGALAVAAIGLGISFLALGLFFYKSVGMTWEETAMLGVTIAGLGLVMGGAGEFFMEIIKGSAAMIVAGIALIVISAGLLVFAQTKLTFQDAAILGATILGLGVVMGIAGAGPVPLFIALGSAAMIVAGLSLVVLSLGLGAFKLTGFKVEDALSLGAAIGAVGVTMGIAGLASPFIILGSAAMAIAGVALMPLALGLAVFKAIGWKKGTDDESLKSALGSVISGFLGGDMPGGILASIKFAAQAAARSVLLFIAIPPLILAGVALLSISLGLAAFKKAGFTSSDSANMEAAIGGIVGAFSLVTDKERQKKMGINVDWMDLMIGIMALSQAGNTLSSLAKGIQAFANLSVIEYEVVGAGTKNAKIVPKGITKLSKSDFESAAYGMAQVIGAIAEPFALVGKLEKGTPSGNPFYDAIFGGGFVSAGIDALSRSGDTLVNLAKGVQAFANLEITEYEVIGAGTKNAKIIPKSITKMSPTDFAAAGANIAKIIAVVAEAFAKVGKDEAASEGVFSGGFLSKGVEALANIGENLQGITESVIKVATGTFTPMTAVQDGKGTKLVPGTPIKISKAMLEEAARTINSVIMVLGQGMMDFGTFVDENEDSIDEAIEYIPTMSEALMKMVEVNEKFSKITDADKGVKSFTSFNQAVMDAYDPAKQKNLPQTAGYMMLFVKGIERLAAPADQLGKVASNVERIEAAMKNIKTHVNGFDMERLTKTDSLFKSMAILSKNPEAMAAKINDTLKVAFEEFGKALTEAIKESGGGGGGGGGGILEGVKDILTPGPAGAAPKATDPKGKAAPGPAPLTAEAIGAAMSKALNAASITIKPAANAVFKTT